MNNEHIWIAEICLLQARFLGLLGLWIDLPMWIEPCAKLVAQAAQGDIDAVIAWRERGTQTDPVPALAQKIIAFVRDAWSAADRRVA